MTNKKFKQQKLNEALVVSSQMNHIELVIMLINMGAEVTYLSNYSLRHAINEGRLELVKILIARGSDINAKCSESKETTLDIAISSGQIDMIKWLAENGMDISRKNIGNTTICDLFILKDVRYENFQPLEIIKFLLEKGISFTEREYELIIEEAAKTGNERILKLIFLKP